MKTISDILFVISNGLILPVLLLLLYMLYRAIYIAITFYSTYQKQKHIAKALKNLIRTYSKASLDSTAKQLAGLESSPVVATYLDMVNNNDDRAYCEHALAEFQVDAEKELAKYRLLVKYGPMLGLMGTLIPMGPALVGLAAGDLTSMAYNMEVAFATTVVGMLIAGLGLAFLNINKQFYARSYNDLEFLHNKFCEK
jgi:biopolymer transport protein ExbB/TolQ